MVIRYGRVVLIGLPVILVMAFLWGGFFRSTDICTGCGRMKMTSRYLWVPVWEVKDTEISGFHDEYHGGGKHRHEWLLVGGGGGAIRCMLGSGRSLTLAASSEITPGVLETIRTKKGEAAAGKWLARLLDTKTSQDAFLAICGINAASADFDADYELMEEEFASAQ